MSGKTPKTGPPKHEPSLVRKKLPSQNGSSAPFPGTLAPRRNSLSRRSSSAERTVGRLKLSKALTIPEGTTVLDACRRMAARRVDAALLTDASALLSGILTDKDLATRVIAEGLKPEETLVSKVMTRNPLFVTCDTSAVDALQKMVQGKFRHLPVVDNGEVIALLDITKCLYDAIARMEKAAEKGDAIAAAVEGVEREWGSRISTSTNFIDLLRNKVYRPSLEPIVAENPKVATVLPTETVYAATKKMRELRVSSVIITSNNKARGILTPKDILMRVIAEKLAPDSTPVEKVMTPNPECATIDTTILDALHIMHDGKFLHLPVTDREGCIVACLDVIHLTQAAVTMVANVEGNTDVASTMQKFWDSAMAADPVDDEDDAHSDTSVSRSIVESLILKHPTLGLGNSFEFKLKDSLGHFHRFKSGTESLAELYSTIAQRFDVDFNIRKPQIRYEDEDGDLVIIASNSDLVNAVNYSRSKGKALKLHLDYPQNASAMKDDPVKHAGETKVSRGGVAMDMDSQQNWGSSAYTAAVAGAAVVVGISMLVFLKRPNT